MKLNFNNRLKQYLINLIIREGDEAAWQHLKSLNPDNDDLYTIIIRTKFLDEAWELTKQQFPTKDDLIPLVKHSEKNKEATDLLLEYFPLDNEELAIMVEYAQNDEAGRMLLNQNPTKEELMAVLQHTSHKNEATSLLLAQELDNDEVVTIIEQSYFKMEAWEHLLQQNPTIEDLTRVVCYTDLEDLAWDYLLKQNPTNEELMVFVKDYGDTGRKRTEATKVIFQQDPDCDILTSIIDKNQLADEAFELLKAKNPTSDDLGWLIWRANHKVNEAAELSLKNKPNKKQLREILEYSNLKNEAATQLVEMPLEISEIVDIALVCSNEKATKLLRDLTNFHWSPEEEQALILQLKAKLIKNPELLDANNWHSGEIHCLGGWAITLVEKAQEIEKQFSTEIAACLLLPNYTHLFFEEQEIVLNELDKLS